jgi:hypothetical protein
VRSWRSISGSGMPSRTSSTARRGDHGALNLVECSDPLWQVSGTGVNRGRGVRTRAHSSWHGARRSLDSALRLHPGRSTAALLNRPVSLADGDDPHACCEKLSSEPEASIRGRAAVRLGGLSSSRSIDILRQHVGALGAMLKDMEPGEARDRVQERHREAIRALEAQKVTEAQQQQEW